MNLKDLDEIIPHPSYEAQFAGRVLLAVLTGSSFIITISVYPVLLWGIGPIVVALMLWAAFRSPREL